METLLEQAWLLWIAASGVVPMVALSGLALFGRHAEEREVSHTVRRLAEVIATDAAEPVCLSLRSDP